MEQDRSFSHQRLDESKMPSEPCEAPTFASLPEGSAFRRVCSNLAACISGLPKGLGNGADAAVFRSGQWKGGPPGRSLLASFLLHVGAIACLVNLPSFPNPLPGRSRSEAPQSEHKIIWYSKAAWLPSVSPPAAIPAPKRRKRAALTSGEK